MAEGLSTATAQGYYGATFQQTAYVIDEIWMQLYLGPPGADGTDNLAIETTRVEVSTCFGSAPVVDTGTVTGSNDAELGPWPSTATEDYSHCALFDGETSTTMVASGVIDGLDDSFSIPIGGCTVIYPTAT